MMSGNHYYLPPPRHFDSVHPREVLPLCEPSPPLLYTPVLPLEARSRISDNASNPISNDFAFSTHIFPASYPRVTPIIPSSTDAHIIYSPSISLSKEERKAKVKKVTDELIDLKARHLKGEFPPDERENRVLWSCVNRYYRKNIGSVTRTGKKSVTLVLFHANGMHKETWETFLRHLIFSLDANTNNDISVDEAWALDETQHGDAALINQGKFSALYDWTDNTRDILNFLSRYLPSRESAFSSDLPVHLLRVSEEVEKKRLKAGFDGERTLVAIGHSLGGATVTLAACTAPRLFTALILVDPTIYPPDINRPNKTYTLVLGAVQRRNTWSSREEAMRLLKASPFFAAWDLEVLDAYVRFGLTPEKEGEEGVVKLKMPCIQEAVVYNEPRVCKEVFERLKDLDPRVMLHWVMAGKGSWVTGSEEATREVVWRRRVNTTNTQIASEHLIVQQAPRELAIEVHSYLERLFAKCGKARL